MGKYVEREKLPGEVKAAENDLWQRGHYKTGDGDYTAQVPRAGSLVAFSLPSRGESDMKEKTKELADSVGAVYPVMFMGRHDGVLFTETELEKFVELVVAAERDALEAELLKLKKGIGGSSMYIQGRWDLIGEFQDIIRARGNRT
jgi:hypothetical protein